MKQIVADESVDFRIVVHLRKIEIDVYSVSEENPSVNDAQVLRIAVDKNALHLTEDKDFGESVFRLQLSHKGILLIRAKNVPNKIGLVSGTIAKYYTEMTGKFSVLDERKLRIKE